MQSFSSVKHSLKMSISRFAIISQNIDLNEGLLANTAFRIFRGDTSAANYSKIEGSCKDSNLVRLD